MHQLALGNSWGQIEPKARHPFSKKYRSPRKNIREWKKANQEVCQDSFFIEINRQRQLIAALDVMSGEKDLTGKEAQRILTYQLSQVASVSEAIVNTIQQSPIDSTFDAVELRDNTWYFYHIGDGGTLLIREGEVIYRTQEHTDFDTFFKHLLPIKEPGKGYSLPELRALMEIPETYERICDQLAEITGIKGRLFTRSNVKRMIQKARFPEFTKVFDAWKNRKTRQQTQQNIVAALLYGSQQTLREALSNPNSARLASPHQIEAQAGDIVACYSDGLSGNLSEQDISNPLSDTTCSIRKRVQKIVETAHAKKQSGTGKIDDIVLVAAEAQKDNWLLNATRQLNWHSQSP